MKKYDPNNTGTVDSNQLQNILIGIASMMKYKQASKKITNAFEEKYKSLNQKLDQLEIKKIAHDYLYISDPTRKAKALVVLEKLLVQSKHKLTTIVNYSALVEHVNNKA